MKASSDPRVIASRERLSEIPQWRLWKIWRETGRHVRLVNEVFAENRRTVDVKEQQMGIRHRFVRTRRRLNEIDRMLHDSAGTIGLPQMESWARELEECAADLESAADEMRSSAACCGWCGPDTNRRHCRLLAGHFGDCRP